MDKVYRALGGRKTALVLLAVALVALSEVLGIGEEKLNLILWLVLGGAGAVALEDSVKRLRGAPPPAEKKDD